MSEQATAIGDYGLIGDCHTAALVSREGSVDWCCLPRFDSGSCFARLLDSERGGFCAVSIEDGASWRGSRYMPETLVLENLLEGAHGTVRLRDFFAMREHGAQEPRRELIRILECERGSAELQFEIAPRFDYGAVRPWLRRAATDTFTAIGGDDGLVVWSDGELRAERESLIASAQIHAGERLRLLIRFVRPHLLEHEQAAPDAGELDARLDETIDWWRAWRTRISWSGHDQDGVVSSALTLKALSYAPTGAIVAAPTTSLPKTLRGERNWDYRYSWVRDSSLTAHALAELGCER